MENIINKAIQTITEFDVTKLDFEKIKTKLRNDPLFAG